MDLPRVYLRQHFVEIAPETDLNNIFFAGGHIFNCFSSFHEYDLSIYPKMYILKKVASDKCRYKSRITFNTNLISR
jgi:hypothetical protein